MAVIRGILTAGLFVAFTVVLMPVQLVFLWSGTRARSDFLPIYHRWLLRLVGIDVKVRGELAQGPVLMASNHASWLDIPVLASLSPLSFIAKLEVKSWPLFGQMAQLQRTVFVNRQRRSQTGNAKSEIEKRLEAGDKLVLFAEGTSSDGNSVLPFRTALFGAAALKLPGAGSGSLAPVAVQPVSIAYVRLHGLPMGRFFRPDFAWYGDMSLAPHLWGVFCAGPVDVTVTFHTPVSLDQFADRKALARHCEAVVRAGVVSSLTGRALAPGDVNRPGAGIQEGSAIAPAV
ncbi:Acyl-CoA:1-acyl-sn-glycerol-3-phosphate acyltransferase [hydrothermal vent metagenome]|uniref:Acyl-CoA:1-acyl-sn-glycerol-3-phosphate acyltransferase n=1 Tax=hydrothermal vent metagenome TaxID=652676 RepID=A0A3B0U403_9ZZZZ